MNLVKEYKGVKIFVSPEGEFYCDTIANSNDYKKKNFSSSKLQSIEKAIDNFKGEEIDGNSYYDILPHINCLKKLKVVRKVGSRLFFNDGTDTSFHSKRQLYPASIEEKQEFKDLQKLLEELNENQEEISRISAIDRKLRERANEIIRKFSKVTVN